VTLKYLGNKDETRNKSLISNDIAQVSNSSQVDFLSRERKQQQPAIPVNMSFGNLTGIYQHCLPPDEE